MDCVSKHIWLENNVEHVDIINYIAQAINTRISRIICELGNDKKWDNLVGDMGLILSGDSKWFQLIRVDKRTDTWSPLSTMWRGEPKREGNSIGSHVSSHFPVPLSPLVTLKYKKVVAFLLNCKYIGCQRPGGRMRGRQASNTCHGFSNDLDTIFLKRGISMVFKFYNQRWSGYRAALCDFKDFFTLTSWVCLCKKFLLRTILT